MTTPMVFDRALVRARRRRAARSGANADFLRERSALELLDRVLDVTRRFERAAAIGGAGAFARAWAASEAARAKIDWLVGADLVAPPPATPGACLVADEERNPFADASLDLVVSPLTLHAVNDLPGALVQIRRALRPDGLFVGQLFGVGTLAELRASLLEAESAHAGGAGPRVAPFASAFDMSHLLMRAGFALPVADTETVTVRYEHPMRLLADLRAMGETNARADRPRRPLARSVLADALTRYQERRGAQDGRVTATFEVVTATGWAPHPSQQQPLRPGSAKARLADALGVAEHSAGEAAGAAGPRARPPKA